MMKKYIAPLFLLLCAPAHMWGALTFSGSPHRVITVKPEASTGLNELYVVYDATPMTVQYTASSDQKVTWYKFGNMGGAYADEVTPTRDGRVTSLPIAGFGDFGLIIEEGTRRYFYWVTDYARHHLDLVALNPSSEKDCTSTFLATQGSGDKINYYTINGAPRTLSRELKVDYSTLVFDSDTKSYQLSSAEDVLEYLSPTIHLHAPLCSTQFTLTGDRFLTEWGMAQSVTSPLIEPYAISATAWASQEVTDYDNEKRQEGAAGSLGGSAPAVITFGAAITDAVVFKEWQMSSDREFVDITTRYNDTEATVTFNEQGTTYVRFAASNADGTCDWYSDTYEVNIGESSLECPNAFSPGNADGVNDEWKVSYKSIIEFECHIFNRWGNKIITLNHPSEGWDGKYRGKLVPSGVYYYVIKAKGSDGKDYKLGGDINIINFKDNRSGSNSSPVE